MLLVLHDACGCSPHNVVMDKIIKYLDAKTGTIAVSEMQGVMPATIRIFGRRFNVASEHPFMLSIPLRQMRWLNVRPMAHLILSLPLMFGLQQPVSGKPNNGTNSVSICSFNKFPLYISVLCLYYRGDRRVCLRSQGLP